MSVVSNRTRDYISERIEFLEKQVNDTNPGSPASGKIIWELKGRIHELQQVRIVLDGGTSVFEQVKGLEVKHAY